MTKTLLLLTAILGLSSSACLKKSTDQQKNWYCEQYDSVVSNIPPLSFKGMKVTKLNYNDVNESRIKFIIKENTRKDTVFSRNDTLIEDYRTMGCTQIE